MTDAQKASHLFMARAVDIGKGRTATFNKRVTEFRNKYAHVADREHFLILVTRQRGGLGQDAQVVGAERRWLRHQRAVRRQADRQVADAGAGPHPDPQPPQLQPVQPSRPRHRQPVRGQGDDRRRPGLLVDAAPAQGGLALARVRRALRQARPRHGRAEGIGRRLRGGAHCHARGSPDVDGRGAGEAEGVPYYRNGNLLHRTVLEGAAQQHAVEQMAKAYGWTYESIVDHRILGSATEVFNALADFPRARPSIWCGQPARHGGRSAGAQRPAGRCAQCADGCRVHQRPRPVDADRRRPACGQSRRAASDSGLLRGLVPLRGGPAVGRTHHRRAAHAGWLAERQPTSGKAVNSVLEIFGPNDTGEDLAAAWGFLTKQDSVALSRIKPNWTSLTRRPVSAGRCTSPPPVNWTRPGSMPSSRSSHRPHPRWRAGATRTP